MLGAELGLPLTLAEGEELGNSVGCKEGLSEGNKLGAELGTPLALAEGEELGLKEGSKLGEPLGLTDGRALGLWLGAELIVGLPVGALLG